MLRILTCCTFEVTVHPKISRATHKYLLSRSADFSINITFWCELQSFGDIGCRDVCPLMNVMELDLLVFLKAPQKYIYMRSIFEKPNSNDSLHKSGPSY